MADLQSRYLGVQPFKTSDKHLFFGRDEDIENLLDTILLEKLIVLFGKSGYGKSSLLNAGIVPRLTDDKQLPNYRFRPIEVRFTTFVEGQSLPPIERMQRLLRDLPITEGSDFLQKLGVSDGLWGQFKQRQGVDNGQLVLIFDQFEEFFSYPIEQQEVFRKQLSELLYTDIPQSARARLGELTDAERCYLAQPMTIKAVFAIRSDRMSFLDSLKDTLPAILHKRYELKPLSIEQAKQAITQPALEAGDNFSSPNFEYTEGGLSAIIKALTTTTGDVKETTTTGVEAFQLQIVCAYIESLVKDGKVPDLDGNGLPDITEAQLPEMSKLYENYYRRKLAELEPALQNAAQLVLEDGLLAEDSTTGESRRMSVDSRALIVQFKQSGLTDALLLALEKTYLIRREANTVGGFSFEISHDTLVEPIQKAKKIRLAIEEKQKTVRRNRRLLGFALLAVGIAAGAIALALWALRQKTEAETQTTIALKAIAAARSSDSLALISRDSALMQKNIAEGKTLEADVAAQEADRQAVAALLANENTAQALTDLKLTSDQAVQLLIKEIDHNILRLEYDSTFQKCQTAVNLKSAQYGDEIKKRILEIAYFYTETETFAAATKSLNLLVINALPNRAALQKAIQTNVSPQYFAFLNERYYPKMLDVEGGTFILGADSLAHKVRVDSYKMGETETTVWQYFLFQKAAKYRKPSTPSWQWNGNNPIVNVSWYDVAFYLNWLNERSGRQKIYTLTNKHGSEEDPEYDVVIEYDKKGYRLPTEAEWEFAARGGINNAPYTYSGSDNLDEVAWYSNNSENRTHPVAGRKPNALGLYDMTGNVWEWCNDWYEEYDISANNNPRGAIKGNSRLLRGASFFKTGTYFRLTLRFISYPRYWNSSYGFRVLQDK